MRTAAVFQLLAAAICAASEASLRGAARRMQQQLPVQPACADDSAAVAPSSAGCCPRYELGLAYSPRSITSQHEGVGSPFECARVCAAEGAPLFTFGHQRPIWRRCLCHAEGSPSEGMGPRRPRGRWLMSGHVCVFPPLVGTAAGSLPVYMSSRGRVEGTSRVHAFRVYSNSDEGTGVRVSESYEGFDWTLEPRYDDSGGSFCYLVATGHQDSDPRFLLSRTGTDGAGLRFYDEGDGRQRWHANVTRRGEPDSQVGPVFVPGDPFGVCPLGYRELSFLGLVGQPTRSLCAFEYSDSFRVLIFSEQGAFLNWAPDSQGTVTVGEFQGLHSTWGFTEE